MMFVQKRRNELGLTVDQLHRQTGVPRFRLLRLEQGVESLRLIPFAQCCALATALEVPLYLWYHWIMSDEYTSFLKGRLIDG